MPRTWKSTTKQVSSFTQTTTVITTTTIKIETKVKSAYKGAGKNKKLLRAASNSAQEGLSWSNGSATSTSGQPGLIIGGEMDGKNLFIIRAVYEGGVYPGELLPENGAAWFGCDRRSFTTQGDIQYLTGNANACRWVAVSGPCTIDKLGAHPVEGGWEPDGTRYLIAQVSLDTGTHCGKVKWNDIASFAFLSGETTYENYNVLVFA